MTLKDYSEFMLHVYDGTEMSHKWKYIDIYMKMWLKCFKEFVFKVYDEMDFFPFSDAWITFFFF